MSDTQKLAGLPEAVARLGAGGSEAFLLAHHLEAARQVSRLFERAQLRQRVTMSYDPARLPGGKSAAQTDLADHAAEARQRLALWAKQLPADCWGVLVDVCVYDKGLQLIEQERGWPRRGAKLVLRIGLDQIALLKGLGANAIGSDTSRTTGWLPERPPMFAPDPN